MQALPASTEGTESLADFVFWKGEQQHPEHASLWLWPESPGLPRCGAERAQALEKPCLLLRESLRSLTGEMKWKWNVNDERFHFLTWGKWRCWWICVIVTFYKHRQCKTISGLPAQQQGFLAPHTGGLRCGRRKKQPDFTSAELTSPPSDLLPT